MKIFLSYGHDEHQVLAEKMASDLTTLSHEVWIDKGRINPNHDWEISIEKGITTSDCVIALMTPHSMRRPDGVCLDELSYARFQGKPIAPIMVQLVQPPLCIARIQWLDMRNYQESTHYTKQFEKLIQVINGEFDLGFEGEQSYLKAILNPIDNDNEIFLHKQQFIGRDWLLDEFDEWLKNEWNTPIFWVKGKAGMGKTAFAAILSHKKSSVVGVHFCKYNDSDRSDPKKIITSLAYSLCTQLPDYATHLTSLPDIKKLYEKNTISLFHYLLVEPLKGMIPPKERHVLLIDALDEITSNELVTALAVNVDKLPNWLAFVVTSRNDVDIERNLSRYNPKVMEANDPRNSDDIRRFLIQTLSSSVEYINESLVQKLLKKSEGNFLYIKEVVREITSGRLLINEIDRFPQGLTGIYYRNFERLFPNPKEEYKQNYRTLLELIAAALEPLPIEIAELILGWDEYDKEEILEPLTPLFIIEKEKITPIHKSLVDWLTDKKKSGGYYVSVKKGNEKLTSHLLQEYSSQSQQISEYGLSHLLEHLIRVEEWGMFEKCLLDPSFMAQRVKQGYLKESLINVREHLAHLDEKKLTYHYSNLIFNEFESLETDYVEFVGELFIIFGDYLLALGVYERLFNRVIQSKEDSKTIDYIARIGDINVRLKNFDKSLHIFHQAILFSEKFRKYDKSIQIYLSLANVYYQIGNTSRVNEMYKKGIEISERLGDHKLLGLSLYDYATYNLYESNYAQANILFEKTMVSYRKLDKLEELLSRVLQQTIRRLGKPIALYFFNWSRTLAIEINDKSTLEMLNEIHNKWFKGKN